MTKKIRVALIFGGKSGEHEVSLASAKSVARALDKNKYDVTLIGITKEGQWLSGGNPLKELISKTQSPLLNSGLNGEAVANENARRDLVTAEQMVEKASPLHSVDVVFPLVHGPMGEDGTIQGLLELADMAYVGAGVAASAVGMDKQLMKDVFRAHGLPVVDEVVILRSNWEHDRSRILELVESKLGYPCFCKPANLGSSVGVTKANNRTQLAEGLTEAARYDRKIIVERGMNAREIECSVLGNDKPIVSLPGEIIPQREFYDYAAKYDDSTGTQLIVPAKLAPEKTREVQTLALQAFQAIDCAGMARVDMFIDRESEKVFLNEINTIPGFTAVSMYPKMWEATGLSYAQLIDKLIELALKRHADKQRNESTFH